MPTKSKILLLVLFSIVTSYSQTSNSFIFHKVIYGETVSMLYKKYFVNPKSIYLLNRFAIDGINKDMILKIPITDTYLEKNKNLEIDSNLQLNYENKYNNFTTFEYVAKSNENLDAVLAKFSLSFKTLLEFNPKFENLKPEDVVTNYIIPTFVDSEKIDFEEKDYADSSAKSDDKFIVNNNDNQVDIYEPKIEPAYGSKKNNPTKTENSPSTTTKLITHNLKHGETLYGLSKKYNVTIDEIFEWNPKVKSKNLLVGTELKIVLNTTTSEESIDQTSIKKLTGIEHTVVKGDTLYSLAKKNNTTIDQIFINNPIIAKKGLLIGLKIKL